MHHICMNTPAFVDVASASFSWFQKQAQFAHGEDKEGTSPSLSTYMWPHTLCIHSEIQCRDIVQIRVGMP